MSKIAFFLFLISAPSFGALDVLTYQLKGKIDWEKKQLDASVRIELSSSSEKVVLDSFVSEIATVTDGLGNPLAFEYEGTQLEISLPRPGFFELVIHYRVTNKPALHVVNHRKGDPIPGRVAFTLSEPLGAKEWMPCHDTPADRAHFSAEFELPKQEKLISNGDLVHDAVSGDVRTMRYHTSYTLPTYLMAFALGDFVEVSHSYKKLPLKVFARPGLPVDFEGVLKNIVEQMATFEKLLVPYPFEKYALVILPEHQSGMEHAGITFQGEIRSTQGLVGHDYSLTAHELAHQWFGNLVTIKEWDDLWVKEGMATLLAEEAQRRFEDENRAGRLFGHGFAVEEGEAIRDPELKPDDKYTDGPYGRAAWLLTQVRAKLGEKKFWGALRKVLTQHAFSAIGTDEFVAAFDLSEVDRTAVYRALAAKKLPRWGNAFELVDEEGSLLSPLSPTYQETYYVLDAMDLHPLSHFGEVTAPLIPSLPEQLTGFLQLGAHVPLLALEKGDTDWPLNEENFLSFWKKLPSEQARFAGLKAACDEQWVEQVEKAMAHPPSLGFPDYDPETALSSCGTAISERLFAKQWKEMETNPTSPLLNESTLILLSSFALSPERALETWGNIAREGATVRAKRLGLMQLRKHYEGVGEFEMPSEAQRPQWTDFFNEILTHVEVGELQAVAKKALARPKNLVLKRRSSSVEMKPWNQPMHVPSEAP